MPMYQLFKHYRGGPEPHHPYPPMDEWDPADAQAHRAFLARVNDELVERGELVDVAALAPTRTWTRSDGAHGEPVTSDGPASGALIAGWYLVDVESRERALEIAALISSEPGPGGEPINEWIDVREVMWRPSR